MKVTIIATSLNKESKSQILASVAHQQLKDLGFSSEVIDLRTLNLPFAGTDEGWASADAEKVKAAVEMSSHIIFAVPIYCYDVNAAAKNVIELIGRSFTKKVISFICAAGGSSSYMSVMGFANHLMLDFRSVIVPRFLYVDPAGWNEDSTLKPEIAERMSQLISDMQEINVTSSEQ